MDLHLELLLPWFDVGLQICSSLGGYWGVAGNVEENQIKSNIVDDEAQQHHWISPESAALVQHAKNAPSWSERSKDGHDKSRGSVPAVSHMHHLLCGSLCTGNAKAAGGCVNCIIQPDEKNFPTFLRSTVFPILLCCGRSGYFSLWTTERGISCHFLPSFRVWLTKNLAHTDANARNADQALRIVAKLRHGSDARPVHPAVKGELQPWRGQQSHQSAKLHLFYGAVPTTCTPTCVRDGKTQQQHLFGDKYFTRFHWNIQTKTAGGRYREALLVCQGFVFKCNSVNLPKASTACEQRAVRGELWRKLTLWCWPLVLKNSTVPQSLAPNFHLTWSWLPWQRYHSSFEKRNGEKITVKGRPPAAGMPQWNKYLLEAGWPGLASLRWEWSIAMKHRSIPRGSNFYLMTLEL